MQKFSDSFTELLDGDPGQARRARLGLRRRRVAIYAEVAGEGAGARARARGDLRQPHVGRAVGAVTRESFRVLRLDLRGFGRTPLEPGPFANARDVIETLEQHGFERAALIGVSLGGRVVLEVALARPELVSALVLVAPGLPGHDWSRGDAATQWAKEEAALEAGDLDEAVEVSLRTWVDGPRRQPEDVDPAVRARVGEMQRRAYELQRDVAEDEEELLVDDLPQRLGDVQVPTLVLVGDEDQSRTCTRSPSGSSARFPVARSATIAETAHVPSMERPTRVRRARAAVPAGGRREHGRARRARRADLGARPDALDRQGRGEVARLAGRADADAQPARRPASASSRSSPRPGRSTPSSCSGWAARASRPR